MTDKTKQIVFTPEGVPCPKVKAALSACSIAYGCIYPAMHPLKDNSELVRDILEAERVPYESGEDYFRIGAAGSNFLRSIREL